MTTQRIGVQQRAKLTRRCRAVLLRADFAPATIDRRLGCTTGGFYLWREPVRAELLLFYKPSHSETALSTISTLKAEWQPRYEAALREAGIRVRQQDSHLLVLGEAVPA